MLHADKRNSCSTERFGEAQYDATCLLRQDKGQQDKLFCSINITYSVDKIICGRPSLCLAAILFGAFPPFCGISLKLRCSSAGFNIGRELSLLLLSITIHGPEVLDLKRHMVALTRSKLCHHSQTVPITAGIASFDPSLMQRGWRLLTQKRRHGTTNMQLC